MRSVVVPLLVPMTLIGVLWLFAPEAIDAQEACVACHFCNWNENYAEAGGGASTHWIDPETLMDPSSCFFWHFCDCLSNEPDLAEARDSALSDLLYGEDVRVSEWVESNLSEFRFTVVAGTLEVASSSCGKVLTWIPLESPVETRRVADIVSLY